MVSGAYILLPSPDPSSFSIHYLSSRLYTGRFDEQRREAFVLLPFRHLGFALTRITRSIGRSNGGPGGSSAFVLFMELGGCAISPNTSAEKTCVKR
ncbi:hypothetical protein OF83DRAFT_1124809 [Amylostereum chailletii]|nr:hypothetical protein OF83DRAFT_1124809 [Amylostereum chailletii]